MAGEQYYRSQFAICKRLSDVGEVLCRDVMKEMTMDEREMFMEECWSVLKEYPLIYRRIRNRITDPFEPQMLGFLIYARINYELKLELYMEIIEKCMTRLYA